MTRSFVPSIIAILLFLGATLSLPVSSVSSLTISASNPRSNSTESAQAGKLPGWTWFWISSDGSQIVPVAGPQDKPRNLTTPYSLSAAENGHSYTFGFANYHGAATPRPGLAKFLFDCEFGLFGQVPASGLGVWTPYPQGKYVCNGNLPGMVRMNLVDNTVGWKMAYHDLAFLIKVLHDTEGVKDEAPFFDFVFNYTDELDDHPYQRIVNGEWVKTYGGTGATSAI
ncbi:hypothetical protein IMSHALPRED_010857 [Imshaugia aleurites]|uniref:Uncharacterized protein n=1 Tax=Imshaugia aleurites TaxID=172621 RepID=A0A8H3IXB4_9LECA|nr:hypothetical protein IMSHALPRED_010857 [Imshaugia aleurites]